MMKRALECILFLVLACFMLPVQAMVAPADVNTSASSSDTLFVDSIYIDLYETFETDVLFRLNDEKLYEDYRDNSISLDRLHKAIESVGIENILEIEIVVQSSPEGVYLRNQWLTEHRTEVISEYMRRNWPMLQEKILVHSVIEAWDDLSIYVEDDTLLSEKTKEKVLSVIFPEEEISIETKKWRMENRLGYDSSVGAVYRYLYRTYYPVLRGAGVQIKFRKHNVPTNFYTQGLTVKPLPDRLKEIDYPIMDRLPVEKEPVTIAALKTNLLFDAVMAPNVTLEIPVGKHLSVHFEDIFPWYHNGYKQCYELWVMGPEVRYWFKKPENRNEKLRGHFVGLYGYTGLYDFQYYFDLCYQGKIWSAGASYGYSFPVGKKKKWNFEMAASVGYANITYQHYYPSLNYDRLIKDVNKAGRVKYFGPTNIKFSLVRPINLNLKSK